jgi:hypothetical protein
MRRLAAATPSNTLSSVVARAVGGRFMLAAVVLAVFWMGRKASRWRLITM